MAGYAVRFQAYNREMSNNNLFPLLEGVIHVRGKDIFEAVERANEKVRTFGFRTVVLNDVQEVCGKRKKE